ncbi:hypothetical protein [Paenibacillus wynnii]|uniref:Uncharacterized protein n=1 Tax=Paenibacillus wynnii TaxID=268407 RepID=A0A098MDC4_9BACL|nr:hypothetical protein [Paenibacillus wynnii]KGE20058.1 hypothetical protein PWYN_12450 [Paenibacillus wynnii]
MSEGSQDINQQFIDGGVIPGQLVGQEAVSKTYVDGQNAGLAGNISTVAASAAAAQATANTGVSAAGAAQSTANTAVGLANNAQGSANTAQSTVDLHKVSTAAHSAANITYAGPVEGAATTKQAIDLVKQRVDTIVAGAGESNTEILDARQPATGPAYPILGARLNGVDAQLAENMLYTKVSLSKTVAPVTGSGNSGATTITLSGSSTFVTGDKIAIAGAGIRKNNVVFSLRASTLPTSNGNITITINESAYVISVTTSDTATTIADKIDAAGLPYTLVSKGAYVLYDTVSPNAISISVNVASTGAVISNVIDNNIQYNYLRTTVTNVSGNQLTIQNALQRTVSGAAVKIDHTEQIRQALITAADTSYRMYFKAGTYNIFDKLDPVVGVTGIYMMGDGSATVLDCSNIVGVYTPYFFSNDIFYYTDGQAFTFTNSDSLLVENIKIIGNYQSLFIFHNTSNVTFNKVAFRMLVANKVNHTAFGVYSDFGQNAPENYLLTNCSFITGGNGLIVLGDLDNPVKDFVIDSCYFNSLESGNFGSYELTEMVKFDTKTKNIKISNSTFDGGHLSALTIEEGCEYVDINHVTFRKATSQFIRLGSGQTSVSCKHISISHCTFDTAIYAIRASAVGSGYNAEDVLIESCTSNMCEVFSNLNNCRSVRFRDNKINDANLTASQSISFANCSGIEVSDTRIPNFASENIFQLYLSGCSDVVVKDNFIYTLYMTLTTNGLVINNDILCRQSLLNNYSVGMYGNRYDKAAVSTSQCLKIESALSETDTGVYDVYSNKFYTSPGLVIAVGSGLQTVRTGYNIEAVDAVISYTWNPASIASGASLASSGISVPGAVFGDLIDVVAPYSLLGMGCTAYVSNSNFVQIVLTNLTGAAVDLANGVWKLKIRKI